MGLRTLSSGCPNFAKIDRISVENKLLEGAINMLENRSKKANYRQMNRGIIAKYYHGSVTRTVGYNVTRHKRTNI